MADLAAQFQRDMLADSREYTKRTRTSPSRYLQMIGEYGGVATARTLALAGTPGEGFTRAWEHKCLNLTSEYLMIFGNGGAYQSLFGEPELVAARKRLRDYGITNPIE